MGRLDSAERVLVESRGELREWFAEHHGRRAGIWLVTWRAAAGRPAPTYDEVVCECLAVGWVDSIARGLDDERTMLYLAPRKPGSGWSRPNKERVDRLEAEGLMTDTGRRVVEAARADGSWSLLDEVEDLVIPADLAAAFDARPGSRETWDAFPRSVRRGILEWIVQAKRPGTRAHRVRETAERAAVGERANQWPGSGNGPRGGPQGGPRSARPGAAG